MWHTTHKGDNRSTTYQCRDLDRALIQRYDSLNMKSLLNFFFIFSVKAVDSEQMMNKSIIF